MTEPINLNELEYVKNDSAFSEEEMNTFDGTRAKVAKVESRVRKSKFGEDGKPLPEGQTIDVMVVAVETAPVKVNSMGTPMAVTEEFSLKKHKSTGKWVASLHEKSKTYKLFKKYGVNTFTDLIGKELVLSKKIRQNGTAYLGISLG